MEGRPCLDVDGEAVVGGRCPDVDREAVVGGRRCPDVDGEAVVEGRPCIDVDGEAVVGEDSICSSITAGRDEYMSLSDKSSSDSGTPTYRTYSVSVGILPQNGV